MRQSTEARKQRAVELAAEGLTAPAIAERLGVSERAVRAYLAQPTSKAALARLRDERLYQLAGRALAEAGPALAVLRAIVEDAAVPATARVAAASRLLDVALRLYEAADLAERVEFLEAERPLERRKGDLLWQRG